MEPFCQYEICIDRGKLLHFNIYLHTNTVAPYKLYNNIQQSDKVNLNKFILHNMIYFFFSPVAMHSSILFSCSCSGSALRKQM